MLDVFLTVDVEVWCDGWDQLEARFPSAFLRYVYGHTPNGDYGLPYQLRLLNDHGLAGVFFVEPLFSTRFGFQPLAEIVGLIREAGQEVQLHLHTEWVDESQPPLLKHSPGKRQYLRCFSRDEQTTLVREAIRLVEKAGNLKVSAFRAGSFGFNRDTLYALAANGITFDSSYNASMFGLDSGVPSGVPVVDVVLCENVYEYPMTVFRDGTGALRHTQVTACSQREMEGLLWQALEARRNSFVILSHGSELLNRRKDRRDDVTVARLRKLCSFLDRHRDSFRVRGFDGLQPRMSSTLPPPLSSPIWKTGVRMVEQVYRLRYR